MVSDLTLLSHQKSTNLSAEAGDQYRRDVEGGGGGGHFMCSATRRVVRPGWVRSREGEWHLVIQSDHWAISQVEISGLTTSNSSPG